MPSSTTRLQLPYPVPDDTVDVPRDVKALAEKLDPLSATSAQGTLVARPAAGIAGRYYWATDTKELFYDTGTVWEPSVVEKSGISFTDSSHIVGGFYAPMTLVPTIHLPGLLVGHVIEFEIAVCADGGTVADSHARVLPGIMPVNKVGVEKTWALEKPWVAAYGPSTQCTVSGAFRFPVQSGEEGEHRIGLFATGYSTGPEILGADGNGSVRWRVARTDNRALPAHVIAFEATIP